MGVASAVRFQLMNKNYQMQLHMHIFSELKYKFVHLGVLSGVDTRFEKDVKYLV